MKKTFTILFTLLLCVSAICNDTIMTMTTSKAIGSEFTFIVKAKVSNTPILVDFGDGNLVNYTIGTSGASITHACVGSQTVKIYGTGIYYLECRENQLTTLDVTKNPALTELICYKNELTALDVTKNTALTNLECYYNQLTTLDVTQNTSLTGLSCHYNQLTTLDITQNTGLRGLGVIGNQLTELDVTKHTKLQGLGCSDNRLTMLDVTQNVALVSLYCENNLLTSLDVTRNKGLEFLHFSNNQLTTLDLSQNKNLIDFLSSGNQLTFASLPIYNEEFEHYEINPQQPMSIKKYINIGDELDLTASGATAYTWKTQSGTTLTEGTDYIIADGKTVFLKDPKESIYCEMTNEAFPGLTIATTFTQLQTPVMPLAITMTTTQDIGSKFSFGLEADNDTIQIDFGDGFLVDHDINSLFKGTLVGPTVKIYATGITYLDCSSNQLTALDVSNSKNLSRLSCGANYLTTLDVTKNTALTILDCSFNSRISLDVTKNTALTSLGCNGDSLTALDVTQNIALTELSCYMNELTTLDVTKNTQLTYINCTDNHLSELDVTNNKELTLIECSENQITELDLSKNTALTYIRCENNQLTTLDVSYSDKFTCLRCDGNQLTFITLPAGYPNLEKFTFSPQQPMPVAKSSNIGDELDLSASGATAYTWKTKGGVTLVEGTDYTINNGKTVFLKDPTDSVYCEMTNEAFPDFTNDKILSTTCLKLALASPTAVADIEAPGVEMYSNQGNIYINTPYNAQVSIYELSGRLVLSGELTTGLNSIQLSNTGVYLVKVLGNNYVSTKKVFVQ